MSKPKSVPVPAGATNGTDAMGGLGGGRVRMPELAAQSIGLVGVSGGLGMLIPAVFATAGRYTWLAYLFAVVALLFASWSITFFARQTASSGALYTFAAKGCGDKAGLLCAGCLLVAYGVGGAGILLGATSTLLTLLQKVQIVATPFGIGHTFATALGLAAVGWLLAGRDIRLSTRLTLCLELLTLALIVGVLIGEAVDDSLLADHRQFVLDEVNLMQLQPGIVLAFFSFVGFESATALGSEARAPLKAIPQAILIAILVPGALFLLGSYTMVGAFGEQPPLDQVDGPLSILAERLGVGMIGLIVEAGIALCFFVAFVASVIAGSRIVFTLARNGHLPEATGRVHVRDATPIAAVHWVVALMVACIAALLGAGTAANDAYGWLSTVATYGYLVAYLLVAVAAPLYLHRLARLRARHLVVSAVAILLLGIPIAGSVYPAPEGAYAHLPYFFVGLLATLLVFMVAVKRRSVVLMSASEPNA